MNKYYWTAVLQLVCTLGVSYLFSEKTRRQVEKAFSDGEVKISYFLPKDQFQFDQSKFDDKRKHLIENIVKRGFWLISCRGQGENVRRAFYTICHDVELLAHGVKECPEDISYVPGEYRDDVLKKIEELKKEEQRLTSQRRGASRASYEREAACDRQRNQIEKCLHGIKNCEDKSLLLEALRQVLTAKPELVDELSFLGVGISFFRVLGAPELLKYSSKMLAGTSLNPSRLRVTFSDRSHFVFTDVYRKWSDNGRSKGVEISTPIQAQIAFAPEKRVISIDFDYNVGSPSDSFYVGKSAFPPPFADELTKKEQKVQSRISALKAFDRTANVPAEHISNGEATLESEKLAQSKRMPEWGVQKQETIKGLKSQIEECFVALQNCEDKELLREVLRNFLIYNPEFVKELHFLKLDYSFFEALEAPELVKFASASIVDPKDLIAYTLTATFSDGTNIISGYGLKIKNGKFIGSPYQSEKAWERVNKDIARHQEENGTNMTHICFVYNVGSFQLKASDLPPAVAEELYRKEAKFLGGFVDEV